MASMDSGQSRPARVGERVRAELSEMLLRGEVRDPRVRDVVISAVRMSGDLSIAKVYVRTLAEATPEQRRRVVEGLDKAAGFLRRQLGPKLQFRRTPELQFLWDEIIDQAVEMERVFAELAEARKQEASIEEAAAKVGPGDDEEPSS